MTGRPFFVAAVLGCALLADAWAAPAAGGCGLPACAVAAAGSPAARAAGTDTDATPDAGPLVASGPPGAQRVTLLACRTGALRVEAALPQALSAPVAADFRGGSLYAATVDGELLRYALPDLRLQARVPLGFVATTLAVASGPEAIVLAGGEGAHPLSAHDPGTLEVLARYSVERPARVSAILDVAGRRRFVVAFADLAELWEIAYAHDAPPVMRGLVHDYRMGEAVTLPCRLTERPFRVQSGTGTLLAGASTFEVLRIDATGAVGVVNLDVRREIERPPMPGAVEPRRVVAWQSGARRGWLIGAPDGSTWVLAPPRWRPTPVIALDTLDARNEVAAAQRRLRALAPLLDASPPATQITTASDGLCAAALDATGRWIGRMDAAP